MGEWEEKLKDLEREKHARIEEYMRLQDRADAVNEQIYQVCCGIEELNRRIDLVREEARKAAAGHPPGNGSRNGTASPPPAP